MIVARGLVKRFGDFTAVDGIDVEVSRGEAFGFLGPNGAGKSSTMRMIGCVSPVDGRHAAGARPRPGRRRGPDPGPARRRAAGGHPRRRADGAREPAGLRPLLRAVPVRGRRAGRSAARVRPARRARHEPGRAAVGRHEAPADHRPVVDQRPRDAVARRADHRPRPAGTARRVGPAVPAQAAGRHAGADHALHGRGRAALRPAGGDGRRPDRGRGIADRS